MSREEEAIATRVVSAAIPTYQDQLLMALNFLGQTHHLQTDAELEAMGELMLDALWRVVEERSKRQKVGRN